jgi:hypothetical protein
MEDRLAIVVDNLKSSINNFLNPGLSDSDAILFMHQFREIIEIKNLQQEFCILNRFCHWTFHSKLSQNKWITKLFIDITMEWHSDDDKYFSQRIGLETLRSDIISLLKSLDIDASKFYVGAKWQGFLMMLLGSLNKKIIELPNNKESNSLVSHLRKKKQGFGLPTLIQVNDQNGKGDFKFLLKYPIEESPFPNVLAIVFDIHYFNYDINF